MSETGEGTKSQKGIRFRFYFVDPSTQERV